MATDKILMFPTIGTLAEVVQSLGLEFAEGADRIQVPCQLHRQIFTFSAKPRPAIVAIAQVRCDIPMSSLPDVRSFIESWNSERINPTAYLRITDDGDLAVAFSSHYPIGMGASFRQLQDFVRRSLDVATIAVEELCDLLHDDVFALNDFARGYEDDKALRTTLFRPRDVDGDPNRELDEITAFNLFLDSSEAPAEFEDPVISVGIADVAEAWKARGIENMEVHEDFIVTGINNILMAAFIDNGPSLLIRGHWDCDVPLTEDLKYFLITNDWNNAPAATRALWIEESDGLQLRIEVAYPITHGLSAEQLDEMITEATQSILRALDVLSVEISGSSPVRWPDN